MITSVQKDLQKATSLKKAAERSLERLNLTNKEKFPEDTLTDYYDIIHKLLEAITLSEGIKFKGEDAHQELIDYVINTNKSGEKIRIFLQQMRDFRNRISYEGLTINENYVKTNSNLINEIISKLLEIPKEEKKLL